MEEPRGMLPRTAARLELARAVGGALIAPLRYLAHVPFRGRIRRQVLRDVEAGAGTPDAVPPVTVPTHRPLRIFLCTAEASGEIHGASLVRRLRERIASAGAPEPEIVAIGGERLRALNVPTIGDPVARAEMGFENVIQSLPYYVGLLEDAARHVRETRPDVVVPIDSPALHVPLARMAKRYGAPIVHLVAPQYWAWAPWRVRAYRKAVDLALTILPHEPAWFARHGVKTRHVGHPLLDALSDVPTTRPNEDARTLALLPGSRRGVIRRSLPWMLDALRDVRVRNPTLDVAVIQSSGEHRELIESILEEHRDKSRRDPSQLDLDLRIAEGDLHGELARTRAAMCTSGTILTDVLHHRLPTVVLYRVPGRHHVWMYRHVLTCPWFASTNLVAGREILPEHCFRGEGPLGEVRLQLADAYGDAATRTRSLADLDDAADRLGPAGAIDRTAGHVLQVASGRAKA